MRDGELNEGLVSADEIRSSWKGSWIWSRNVDADRNAYSFFRRTFKSRTRGRLEIHITANNFYTLYLDGRFISRGPIRSHLEYYSFDSFELDVERGEHCLAAAAHHVGEPNATMYEGRPGFLADAEMEDEEGVTDLSTGKEWKCLAASAWKKELPCLMSHFGFWEELDFRDYPHGWTDASFKDGDWKAPAVIGEAGCEPLLST